MSRIWAVIPAAGQGSRFGGDCPKQYLPLAGKVIIERSIAAILHCPDLAGLVVALGPADSRFASLACASDPRVHTVTGGDDRARSVENALDYLSARADTDDWVLVHDAARPCLSWSELQALLSAGESSSEGALLALPVVDTLKRVDSDGRVVATVERDQLWRAQTPQYFPLFKLRDALRHCRLAGEQVTDEASAMQAVDARPRVVAGSHRNIKITLPEDLALAEGFLRELQQQVQQ